MPVEILREDSDAYRSESERWLNDTWLPTLEDGRDALLQIDGNSKRYTDLLHAVERRQVIPLIGSGMSVASGCPTWSNLLRKIRDFTKIDVAALEKLLSAGGFEEAADLIASGTNPNLLNERVEHDLRIDDPKQINGAVRIIPAVFPNFAITTNLDDVLEQLYAQCGVSFAHVLAGVDVSRYRQLKNPNTRFLLKLHGDCRLPYTRVLLKAEYDKAYGPGQANREELILLYRSNSVLFMGFSLGSDRTVNLVSEVAKTDKSMPKHYAFLRLPESQELRIDRENFLSECGIYPIWYDEDHDTSLILLLSGLLAAAGALT